MTEFQATSLLPPGQTYGKGNMASAAFAELRAARLEGRTPEETREGASLSFSDVVDTLNPLQHVPVLSDIYRRLTGDAISPQARVAGGTLYGGPIGGIASVLSLAVTGDAQQGIGDRLIAGLFGDSKAESTPTRVASATPPQVAMAEAKADDLITASLAAEVPEAAPLAANLSALPGLSPEAFEALIGSFADPGEVASLKQDAPEETGKDNGLIAAMTRAIDKYEAMKPETIGAKTDEQG
jgi:hypothetical protein